MKKIFVFGNPQCPDCVILKDFLEANGIRFTYIDIMSGLGKLKMFLKYRDSRPEFDAVRGSGSIGIPLLVVEDGEWVSLDPPSNDMLSRLKE